MVLPQNTLLAVLAVLASTPGGLASVLPRMPAQNDINGDPSRIAESWDPQGAHGLANPKVAEGIRASHERTACATVIHGVCQPSADKPLPEAEEPARLTLTKPKPVSGGGHAKCGAARKKESPILKSRDLNYLPPRPPPEDLNHLPPRPPPDWRKTKPEVVKSPESTPEPEAKETAQPPAEGVPAEDDSQKDARTSVTRKVPYQHREFDKPPQPPASYLFVENLGIGLDPSKEVVPPAYTRAGQLALLNAGLRFWTLRLEPPWRPEHLACFQVDYENPENANRLLCRKVTRDLTILHDEKGLPRAFLYQNEGGRHLFRQRPWRGEPEAGKGQTGFVEAIPIRVVPGNRRRPFGPGSRYGPDWNPLGESGKSRFNPENGKASEPKAKEPVATPETKKAEAPVVVPAPKKVETPVESPKTEQPEESSQSVETTPKETGSSSGQETY